MKKIAPRHARHTGELLRLKRIQGQIAGVENMILNERYCPDIILQVKAVTSALKSLELSILEGHIRHCLAKTLAKGSKKEVQKKIDEIILVLDRRGF
ncbi:MAG: hypothetical protein A2Z20_11320 [Bdellovibrionales bacterium RBG_16_40_8]|nr:MAG: hypothetical protein A2Z20_11320 [Bdellovibrionales bacterium RBG_16_40_8]